MKTLTVILLIAISASCCSRSNIAKAKDNEKSTDSLSIPVCLQEIIKQHELADKQNPPIKIYSYTYKDSLVYYETAHCCDMYSNLYNNRCELLGHPDGGFTGRGDGKFPGFDKEATNQKLIWEDKRN